MRLRLSIRRNGLPETLVIWAIDTTPSPTIYHLLEQVNEVVPIESDDQWGLEDYAVELKGNNGINYECLHFQYVASVMKEDDEVIIRCLLPNDSRKRRVSGRTQITVDGKRLIDGVPLGRPLLRTIATRPSIKIRPKNISSLTFEYGNEDKEDREDCETLKQNESRPNKVFIQSDRRFEYDSNHDSDSDEDYDPGDGADGGSDIESDYSSEVILDEDQESSESGDSDKSQENKNKRLFSQPVKKISTTFGQSFSGQGGSIHGSAGTSGLQVQTRILHSAFPTSSLPICKYVLTGTSGDIKQAWEAMSIGFPYSKSQGEVIKLISKKNSKSKCGEVVAENTVALYNPDCQYVSDSNSRKGDLLSESIASGKTLSIMTEASDKLGCCSDILKPVSISSNLAVQTPSNDKLSCDGKKMVNLAKESEELDTNSRCNDKSLPLCNDLENGIDNITTSSSISSETPIKKSKSNNNLYSYSSDDSSSDSSCNNQELENLSTKVTVDMKCTISDNVCNEKLSRPNVAPGQGKKATRLRNERRRISNSIRRLKEKGILPAGISKEEFRVLYEKRKSSVVVQQTCVQTEPGFLSPKSLNSVKVDDEFQRRRKELLDSLASGGIDVHNDFSKSDKLSSANLPLNKISDLDSNPYNQAPISWSELDSKRIGEDELLEKDAVKIPVAAGNLKLQTSIIPQNDQIQFEKLSQKSKNSSQQSTLNLDAGRRMVFGAMGLKPPVTKQDEEIIRKKLMNNSKASKRPEENILETKILGDETLELKAWRDKIIYRAKECVQSDVELGEPPFPFFQRWDPQQKIQKRKRILNCQKQTLSAPKGIGKRQKKNSNSNNAEEQNSFKVISASNNKEITTKYDPITDNKSKSPIVSRTIDIETQYLDDQIPLPNDLSSFPDLKESQAKVSMVIVFKQLEVTAASRWQPQVSDYRTATITSVEKGTIQVQLAQRDFYVAEKLYNEQGERIYRGFETDLEEIEDDGWRELHFNDLIEPKILSSVEQN